MQQDNKPTVTSTTGNEELSSSVVKKTTKTISDKNESRSSAGVIVLQWLSYAFWGWLILALIWLVSITLTNAITGRAVEEVVPYAMAAAIVLLPIAFVTDLFYRKHEPRKKEGAATVIMVIHAVLFALLGIGSLITAVFLGISMIIGSGSQSDIRTISLLTALFAAIMYVLVFVRTLNPLKVSKVAYFYGVGMLILTGILLVLGTAGPLVKSITLRDDRRIEKNLSYVESAVSGYVTDNKKLPDSLNDVDYSQPDAKSLVTDGLVEYKKEQSVSASSKTSSSSNRTEFRYQLCVTYKQKSNQTRYNPNGNSYSTYVSTSGHSAGEVCYKLKTLVYLYNTAY